MIPKRLPANKKSKYMKLWHNTCRDGALSMYALVRTWLAAGVVFSLLKAQSPWTQWNVYADSTGNGANPVTGLSPICPDTFWLIVDTSGMGAAGITGWKWTLSNVGGNVVYDGTAAPPYFFPTSGVTGSRKLGVGFNFGGLNGAVLLKVYFASGDSAGIAKGLPLKSFPSINLLSPSSTQLLCPGTNVSFTFNVTGADSFKIGYGPNPSDTVRNQSTFNATVPNAPSWNITVFAYSCGNVYTGRNLFFTNPASNSVSVQIAPSNKFCPGGNVTFQLPSFVDITGSTSLSLVVKDPSNTTVHTATTLPSTWTLPNTAPAGTYTAQLTVTYPCGSTPLTSVTFIVYGPTSLSAPTISPNGPPYCEGAPISLYASVAEGLISWDIGNNGTWDYIGSPSITHTFSSVPPAGIPIKIRQDVGCYTREDVITWNKGSGSPIPGGFAVVTPFNVPCPGQNFQVELVSVTNFAFGPGNTLTWQAPWLNSGNPFNGFSFDTLLPAPPTTGLHTLTFTLTNSCGGSHTGINSLSVGNSFLSLPDILGRVCAGGGNVLAVAPTLAGLLGVKYMDPNGTVVATSGPGDTVSLSVPSVGLFLTVEYNFGCAKEYYPLSILPSTAPATIQTSNLSTSTTCPGATISAFAFGQHGQNIQVYYNNSLIAQQPVVQIGPSNYTASISFPTPPASGTIKIVVTGCGGNDSVSYPLTIQGNGAVAAFNAPGSACVGQPVTFQRTGSNQGIYSADWSIGNTFFSDTSMSVSYTFSDPGVYTIGLSVQSTCGITYASKTLKVYGNAPTLSGLSIVPSGSQIAYSVNAADADSVKWFFNAPNLTPSALGTSGTYDYGASGTYTVWVIAYNPCGTDTLTQNVTVTSSSIPSVSRTGEWLLYPNPARHEVVLSHSTYVGPAQIQILDLQGRIVSHYPANVLPARLSLNLPSGLYQVQVLTQEGSTTLRLAVE